MNLKGALRSVVSRNLSENQKIRLKRLRNGEAAWQRTLAGSFSKRLTFNLAYGASSAEGSTTIERGYDARQQMRESRDRIRLLLAEAGVESVELPRLSVYRPILVIRQADVPLALRALSGLRADEGWQIRAFGEFRRKLRSDAVLKDPDSLFRLTLRRKVVAENGREMSTYRGVVSIEPWEELGFNTPRVDGDTHLEGTLHRRLRAPRTFVDYIPPAQWRTIVDDSEGCLRLPSPHLYQVDAPVDLVYTWVDGEDPEWARRKSAALGQVDPTAINETAASASRFESREELKYSLRSVEYYASWINHIFIVTDGQTPAWLDTEHPKITVVDHRDIFTDTAVLPVFNSHAIESQLHHIPGLSEHYLYMNDDLMFLRPTDPELFFSGNGMSKYFPSKASLDIAERSARDMPVLSAAKRGREFMEERFGRTVTNKFKHTPHPQLKSVLEHMESENQAMFDAVAASRFRHPDDFSIPSALYHYYAYAIRRAHIGSIRYAYMDIAREDSRMYLDRLARRRDLDVLCLNDTDLPDDRRGDLEQLLRGFFRERFPVPSTFEWV